jgi:hypothetical protein
MSRITNGRLLLGIGVLHNAVGFILGMGWVKAPGLDGQRVLPAIAADGLVGAIDGHPWRVALFWFMFFGFAVLMAGALMDRIERAGQTLPRALGWHLAALALGGALFIPMSGFWLALPVAWRILRAPRSPRPEPGSVSVKGPAHRRARGAAAAPWTGPPVSRPL